MKYLIILAVICLTGCIDGAPYQKPFIIVEKYKMNRCYDSYSFVDKNGSLSDVFHDDTNKYSIGDTLK